MASRKTTDRARTLSAASNRDGASDDVFSDVAYTFDGSLEGLLSAVFAAYEHHERPRDIGAVDRLALRLGQTARFIPTDIERARRVERGVVRTCGRGAFAGLQRAYLSWDDEAPGAVYRFVRHCMDHPTPSPCQQCSRNNRCASPCRRAQAYGVLSEISHPAVEPIFRLGRRVTNEREKMLQFLRFEHLEGDLWYARCNPSCLVIPTLMGHFCARFSGAAFIIHDEVHQMAGIGEGSRWMLADLRDKPAEDALGRPLPKPMAEEETMQAAWQSFYDAIAIGARYNPELRRSFMPVRFWSYLTEMRQRLSD